MGKEQFISKFESYIKSGDISQSQLQQIVEDMENYGLCAKVPYRGLQPYNGRVTVSTVGAERNVNMRVYDELETVFDPLQRDPYGWINRDNMSKNRK